MSKFEKSMEEIFDVVPKEAPETKELLPAEKPVLPIEQKSAPTVSEFDKQLDKDYEESRNNLKTLVDQGNEAIETLLDIAKESEHPRAFEVVATLIKNTAEVNEKLLALQKSVREMKGMNRRDSGNVTVDKAIFVGSTSELSKLIKNRNKPTDEQQ